MACLARAGAATNTTREVQFREPRSARYVLLETTNSTAPTKALLAASATRPQWTLARPAGGATNTVLLGSRVVLRVEPGMDISPLLTNLGLTLSRTVSSNLFILQAADSAAAIDAAEALAKEDGVLASYPVTRRAMRRFNAYTAAPNDPYFDEQWHLESRGGDGNLTGLDLNARAAWPVSRGTNIVVAVVDDGVQLDHPDLVTRLTADLNHNFFEDTSDAGPVSSDSSHATALAGLIAAEGDNQVGVSGVAPQAHLTSWAIWGTAWRFGQSETIASDEQLMEMYQYASNRVAVQNHSWGNGSSTQQGLDSLTDVGVGNAVTLGREGRGVVIVRAGGNGRDGIMNVNDDGYASDPRVIAVAAIRKDGRACSYSNPGASLLVGAPSGDVLDDGTTMDPDAPGVLTTDRTGGLGYNTNLNDRPDYYADFDGTSASTPQIAGTVALMLSANANLTSRDVQHILVHSSRFLGSADPDMHTNGAGFLVSHNAGYGVPDTGFAVSLAKGWSNLPASKRIAFTNSGTQAIPDDALRVVCAAVGISNALTSIRCLSSLGAHPDTLIAPLPLAYVGQANAELTQDLHGKGALIQRGTSTFSDKIARAARAGASFALIFNNVEKTNLVVMAGTAFAAIPAVFIGQTDGEMLRDFLAAHADTTAQLRLTPATYRFMVSDTLVCEHVGIRIKTTHPSRSDLRVTLLSPMGTRSVLQTWNDDTGTDLSDWTYWSTQHCYESSAGEWRLDVSDELKTMLTSFGSSRSYSATGSVTYAELIIDGVPIVDQDRDGLDDKWEVAHFGNLNYGPDDNPAGDGFSNARKQILGADPVRPMATFALDYSELKSGYGRLSWPARAGATYEVLSGTDPSLATRTLTNLTGRLPVAEFVVPRTNAYRFFRVSDVTPH